MNVIKLDDYTRQVVVVGPESKSPITAIGCFVGLEFRTYGDNGLMYCMTPQSARRLAETLWDEASRAEFEKLSPYKRGCKIPQGAKYMIADACGVVAEGLAAPDVTRSRVFGFVDNPMFEVRVSEQRETELCEGNRDVIEVLLNTSPAYVRFWMRDEKDPHLWYAPSLFGGVTSKTTEEMLMDYGSLLEDV